MSRLNVLKSDEARSGLAQQARGSGGQWSLWRAGIFLLMASILLWGLIFLGVSYIF